MHARSGFDERMDREINRLREDSQREIENLKLSSKDLIDREHKILKEAKDSLESECDTLRKREDTYINENRRLIKELSQLNIDKNQEISELRAELKMKIFEVTSLGASYEEKMSRLRQVEIELEASKEENLARK